LSTKQYFFFDVGKWLEEHGIPILAAVLAHRTPPPLAQIRAPLLSGDLACASFLKSDGFGCHVFLKRGLLSPCRFLIEWRNPT
jgi:hypothetical protein